MHVDFSTAYLDGYLCQFTPEVTPGSTSVTGAQWDYYNYDSGTWSTDYTSDPTIAYFTPQPYPMCYTVQAFDPMASQPCITTVCKLVAPQAYADCASLIVNFGIAGASAGTITFEDLTQFPAGVVQNTFWSFGDGSSIISSPSPSHTFQGNGPFEVCLTVVGAPPSYCTATLCQWLYLGPAGLPCSEVVTQGFAVLQYENLVGVVDTSNVTGMNARYDWDFGDGAVGTGRIVAHAYVPQQSYSICGTLRAWGPLLSDTCVSTICREVFIMPEVSVAELGGYNARLAWPSPFTDALTVVPSPEWRTLELLDGAGRIVFRRRLAPSAEPSTLPLAHLSAGSYILLLDGVRDRALQRLVKQP
ncbi:MAG: hypothetical protein IPK70_00855 [Flavobacteriales bacterium]|nr:hypothetical protein [Flavobacteriales bacterium]